MRPWSTAGGGTPAAGEEPILERMRRDRDLGELKLKEAITMGTPRPTVEEAASELGLDRDPLEEAAVRVEETIDVALAAGWGTDSLQERLDGYFDRIED